MTNTLREQPTLLLVSPPARLGYTNDRTLSGGIGVSRKLKPFERDTLDLPPIDILYTAAVAEQVGARVTIADLLLDRLQGPAAEEYCEARAGAKGGAPRWIGVRLSMPSLPADLAFANRLKRRMPDARVFVFGSVLMTTLDHWAHECDCDFALFGEPEAVIAGLLTAPNPERAPGVIVPRRHLPLAGAELWSGAPNEARHAGWINASTLQDLPRPAWHLLDMKRYAPDGSGDTSKVGVFVQASRGCPIACNMCPYMLLEGKPWRSNELDAVVDEIEYLNKTWGIYRVRFRDPNFGFNRRYARQLSEAIIRRGVRLEATAETSVEVLDAETLETMYRAGIKTVTTGVETDDPECMASIGQKIGVNAKLRERIALCHQIGFRIYGTYVLGAPEENWNTVRRTWMLARELDVESGFTVMTPFPGTPMYWRAIEEGLIPKRMRFSEWNSYTATMRTRFLTTHDLDVARLWARLETILPYRRKRVKGTLPTVAYYVKHVPHFLARWYCRAYVWCRQAQQGDSGTGEIAESAGVASASAG